MDAARLRLFSGLVPTRCGAAVFDVLGHAATAKEDPCTVDSCYNPKTESNKIDPYGVSHLLSIGALIGVLLVIGIAVEEESSEAAENANPEYAEEPYDSVSMCTEMMIG